MATMASSFSLLLPTLSLLLLACSATARPGLHFHPCKTLLVSTYTLSFQPRNPHYDRPEFLAVVAEVRELHPKPRPLDVPGFFPENPQFRHHHHLPHGLLRTDEDQQTLIRRPELSLGSSSLRDRTVDILNVLASLMFGAGCGALTAGTMYLIWSLFNGRVEAYRSFDDFSDDDDDDDDDDIFNPKKVHNNNNKKDGGNAAAPSPADSAETPLLKKESV